MSDSDETGESSQVTTLELFFDLVFVFTLTQLTRLLSEDLTPSGVVKVVLVFGVLWYMYGGYAWLTNQVPPRKPKQQLLMLLGMAGFLTAAVAIPELFDQTGPLFGIGYLIVVVVHLLLFMQSPLVKGVARLAPFNLAAAIVVLVSGFVSSDLRPVLLLAALLLQFVTPYLGVAPKFEIKAKHFVERHGLLMIVALGETVIAIGLGIDPTNLDGLVLVTMLLTFTIPAALWWGYFADDAASTIDALDSKEQELRSILAVRGYFYAHIPMLLGVVIIATGIHEALANPSEPPSLPVAFALGGGVAAFLLGDAEFRRVLELGPNRSRVVIALLALASIPVGVLIPVWTHVLLLAVLVVAVLAGGRTHPDEASEAG